MSDYEIVLKGVPVDYSLEYLEESFKDQYKFSPKQFTPFRLSGTNLKYNNIRISITNDQYLSIKSNPLKTFHIVKNDFAIEVCGIQPQMKIFKLISSVKHKPLRYERKKKSVILFMKNENEKTDVLKLQSIKMDNYVKRKKVTHTFNVVNYPTPQETYKIDVIFPTVIQIQCHNKELICDRLIDFLEDNYTIKREDVKLFDDCLYIVGVQGVKSIMSESEISYYDENVKFTIKNSDFIDDELKSIINVKNNSSSDDDDDDNNNNNNNNEMNKTQEKNNVKVKKLTKEQIIQRRMNVKRNTKFFFENMEKFLSKVIMDVKNEKVLEFLKLSYNNTKYFSDIIALSYRKSLSILNDLQRMGTIGLEKITVEKKLKALNIFCMMQTLNVLKKGKYYYVQSKKLKKEVDIDQQNFVSTMFISTFPFNIPKYPMYENTKVYCSPMDCVGIIKSLQKTCNPVLFYCAHPFKENGFWDFGFSNCEENLTRRSNYVNFLANPLRLNLKKNWKIPLQEFGGVYSKDVTFFRGTEQFGYNFLENPIKVPIIGFGFYKCHNHHLKKHGNNRYLSRIIEKKTLQKFTTMLNICIHNGHDSLVIQDFSLELNNPTKHLSQIFMKGIKDYGGYFKLIVIQARTNYEIFSKVFGTKDNPFIAEKNERPKSMLPENVRTQPMLT